MNFSQIVDAWLAGNEDTYSAGVSVCMEAIGTLRYTIGVVVDGEVYVCKPVRGKKGRAMRRRLRDLTRELAVRRVPFATIANFA